MGNQANLCSKHASSKTMQIQDRLRFDVGFCRAWPAWMTFGIQHAWESISLMDYGQQAESGRGRQRVTGKQGERERGVSCASLSCSSAICWLVEDTLMFRRGRRGKTKAEKTVASGNVWLQSGVAQANWSSSVQALLSDRMLMWS